MFAFSSLRVNAMNIGNDTSLSDFILLGLFSYSPYDFFLFTLSSWPLLLPWLATSSSSCSLRLTGDCIPPCTLFSASSPSWTWPRWAQWYPRWQPTLSQEVNSSLRAAMPLRSSSSWKSWPMTGTWLCVTLCYRYLVFMKWKTCYLMAWHPGWVE